MAVKHTTIAISIYFSTKKIYTITCQYDSPNKLKSKNF